MNTVNYKTPQLLDSARAWRTYTGGSKIDALHRLAAKGDGHFPEEWILSVVVARNAGREASPDEGLSMLAGSGLSLRDYIARDPYSALGEKHVGAIGPTTGVLLKLIDAAERLTIQVHPDKAAARELFGSDFGKTECWHILDGRRINGETPCIYLGFKKGVTRRQWEDVFIRQDIPAMLDCLHRFDAAPGETVLIHGGVPHAIGGGCMLIEVQEPTDFTIRTERVTPSGLEIADAMCHQGLGFEKMFDCFHYETLTAEEAKRRWFLSETDIACCDGVRTVRLAGYEDTPCFSLIRHHIAQSGQFKPGGVFFGLYAYAGGGTLRCGEQEFPLAPGTQVFVPAESKAFAIDADAPMTLFECRGPDPDR